MFPRLLWLAITLTCLSVIAVAPSGQAAPTATAVRLQGQLQIDGALDEPAWQLAPWHGPFVSASSAVEGTNPPAAVKTQFRVLYDDDALYVGVECEEPQPEKIVARYAEHDQDVYNDDCVEIFFDPAGEGRYYHHFVVNTRGAWFDDTGADYGLVHAKLWECPLEVGVRVEAEQKLWRAEIRIPFAALNLRDSVQNEWLFNVTRERYAGGRQELFTWSPLKGNFHAPRLFGKLVGLQVDWRHLAWRLGAPQTAISGDGSGNHLLRLKTSLTNETGRQARVILTAHPFLQPASSVRSEPLEIASGATVTIELPALVLRGSPREAIVQLNVLSAATQRPWKISVLHLDTEYRPLALDIIQPNYRQNIYATQKITELVFRALLAPDVSAQTTRLVFSLRDGTGRVVQQGQANRAQLAEPLKLPVAALPPGRYELCASLLNAQGQTIAETKTVVRKLPPARGSEVRIDERGNILVNGQPVVFIGWYGGIPTEDPRPEVRALQNIQTPVVLSGLDPTPVREAFAKGIYSIVSIEPGRMFYTFNWWRDPQIKLHQEITQQDAPSEEFLGYLKRLVDCVKDEPGLLGYYLADEPEINNARSSYLEAVYRAMQELDPYHPVFITNDTLDGIVTHGYRACDVLNPDPYSPEPEYVPNFMKRCREVMSRGHGLMMTPWHASGQAHFMTAWGTAPPYPYRTMRMQYLEALAYGCRGFTGYTSAFFMPEIELRYGLPYIWREVRFLEPALAQPLPQPQVEAEAEVIAWAGTAQGHLYFIVVNHKPGTRTITVRHPALAQRKTLVVVSEGRIVTVTRGAFVDRFAQGDARIYTTDPAGARLPTIAAIEKQLAERKAASVKPGNLLHNSLGVRARAAEGYFAPWFDQYYYYALNGITDDSGWQLSHTDKPSWLEITLPEAKRIGRVVLYTPNVRDYDLQFQGPDGTIHVAELRGNTEEVVTHNFTPPIPTLKLRLTILAVRDGPGTKNAIVREIEAYEAAGAGAVTPIRTIATGAPSLTFVPPTDETEGQPILWRENFTPFETAPQFYWDARDTKWVLNPDKIWTQPQPGGGLIVASIAPEGYASMSHFFPADPQYRYFQAKISRIEGEGYRWLTIAFGESSGKIPCRTAVHTSRPSIFTVDTHYVNEGFARGEIKQAFINLFAAGSGKNADGSPRKGPQFTVDWLQLVRRPEDGLIVTLAEGRPLPPVLQRGDSLLFRVFLQQPALDVVVEALGGATYSPVLINGAPYVQLQRVGAKDGREWAAQIRLDKGTTPFDASRGYPLTFRAVVTGGAIADTCQTVSLKISDE